MDPVRPPRGGRHPRLVPWVGLAIGLALLGHPGVKLTVSHRWSGLYLLRGPLEVKDDLLMGEELRVIHGFTRHGDRRAEVGSGARELSSGDPVAPSLSLEWDEADGGGHVENRLSDGARLVTYFGRFVSGSGSRARGLFVGGGPAEAVLARTTDRLDETGMSLFDGRRWRHVWCTVNESIASGTSGQNDPVARWTFRGSRVIASDTRHVELSSHHEVILDGVPILVERRAYFTAGEPYFRLAIRLTNAGASTVRYVYMYGDEPWLGHYARSAGNVGWTGRGLVRTEGLFAAAGQSFAGMYDEPTGTASFLEWFGDTGPDLFYFSNAPGELVPSREPVPLAGDTIFVGLEWRRELAPREAAHMMLAVGAARGVPGSAPPALPKVAVHF